MNIKCVISKKNCENVTFKDDYIKINVNNKKDALFSKFISKGKNLKIKDDNDNNVKNKIQKENKGKIPH